MSVGLPSRSERDLSDEERRLLADAHAELRDAVAAYERLLSETPQLNGAPEGVDGQPIRQAQERVDAAEDHLWGLRERLLGWPRPSWAPKASLVSDWFSDEDADYDQVVDPTRS